MGSSVPASDTSRDRQERWDRVRQVLERRQLTQNASPEQATDSWIQERFVARARALFYARLMFLTLGFLLLAVPAWAEHFGLSGPLPLAGYVAMILYSVANYLVINHRTAGRWVTYVTLCFDLVILVALISRPEVGGGLRSPLLATQLLFTALFAILFPRPVALLPPLLVILVTGRLDLLLHRSISAVELLTVCWYLALNVIVVYVLVYLNEREAAAHREVVTLQSDLRELAVLDERSRLAREIHDGLGASLSSLIIQSEYLLQLAQTDAMRAEIEELKDAAEEAIEELRRNLQMMREDFELAQGLEDYIKTFTERTQLEVSFEKDGVSQRIPPDAQLTLFRVLQESLSNAVKHAQARSVKVKLAFEPDKVLLSIRDDGKGFAAATAPKGHYGLLNMRERALKIGGQIVIDSAPGAGTFICVEVPTGNR